MINATKLAREALEKARDRLAEFAKGRVLYPQDVARRAVDDVDEALAALSTAPGESALRDALDDLIHEINHCDPLDLPPSLNLSAGRAFNLLVAQPTAPGEREGADALARLQAENEELRAAIMGGRPDYSFGLTQATFLAMARELHAALPTAPATNDWQPIASLPNTDEMILAGRTSDGAQMVWRASLLYRQVHLGSPPHLSYYPTYWKRLDPLPAALAQETSNG